MKLSSRSEDFTLEIICFGFGLSALTSVLVSVLHSFGLDLDLASTPLNFSLDSGLTGLGLANGGHEYSLTRISLDFTQGLCPTFESMAILSGSPTI